MTSIPESGTLPTPRSEKFTIKDSGERQEFASGMVRDTADDKIDFLGIMKWGPMFVRWAKHATAGRKKYPDPEPGVPNWTLAEGPEEFLRFQQSAARHFQAWIEGKRDEDHGAGVIFNINGAEYVREKMEAAPEFAPGEVISYDPLRPVVIVEPEGSREIG